MPVQNKTIHAVRDACADHAYAFVGMAVQRAIDDLVAKGTFTLGDAVTAERLITIYTWINHHALADNDLFRLSMVHPTARPVDDAMNYVRSLLPK